MCGITGCISKGNATKIGLEALRRLEYRGYDSAGIALKKGHSISVLKGKGRIGELDTRLDISGMKGDLAIMHTRWATHGEPNSTNAHPHTDCGDSIAIVHNGIIENYAALKKVLEAEGHVFRSQTDSEVIAHLIEKFYNGNLRDAVRLSLPLLEGAYAIAAICKDEDVIVAARRGSPLVIGVGDGIIMLASDAAAIVGFAKNMIYINDGEIVELKEGSYSITDAKNKPVERGLETLALTLDQIERGGFKHFMLKEIFEQPDSIRNVLRGRISNGIKLSIGDVESAKRIIITACGTSWHSALIGKYLLEGIAKVQTEVDYASEFRYRNPLIGPGDLVIAISQSGETADTLAAIKEAKERGAKTLGIVNVVGSSIARLVDSGIYLHAGPEIGVASTKAFTSQLTALCLLALYIRQQKTGSLDEGFRKELLSLPDKLFESLNVDADVKEIAEEFAGHKNFLYLGRGINFPVALEGALKLKEISYIHAEGYPAAEMKHGPIALIDKDMPVLFIATEQGSLSKILSNMQEVRARGGRIIAVASQESEEIIKLAEHVIYVPKTIDELSPIINVVPLQLLAYHIADIRGLDVDKPRNLAKSVTVE